MKSLEKLASGIVLIAIGSLWTAGATQASDGLGQHWPELVQGLRSKGIAKVGDFDLSKFSLQVQTIQWNAMTAPAPSEIRGPRTSAYFVRSEKSEDPSSPPAPPKVFIAPTAIAQAANPGNSLPQLELHESLGALGYNDQNYQMSTAISMLGSSSDTQTRTALQKAFATSIFTNAAMADAGGSSVGGGGDISAILLKNQVLALVMKDSKFATLDFLSNFPNIDFEPVENPAVHEVVLDYKFRNGNALHLEADRGIPGAIDHHGQQELISFFYPLRAWNAGGKARLRILAQIRQKLEVLFPLIAGGDTSLRRGSCESTEGLEFNKSLDATILRIQEVRSYLLRGCKSEESEFEVQTPPIPQRAAPRTPGKFTFACVTEYESHNTNFEASSVEGQANDYNRTLSLEPGDTLFAGVQLSPKGAIVGLSIFYHDAQGSPPVYKLAKFNEMSKAETTMSILGKTVKLTCSRNP